MTPQPHSGFVQLQRRPSFIFMFVQPPHKFIVDVPGETQILLRISRRYRSSSRRCAAS
jgi:hypothetical protein